MIVDFDAFEVLWGRVEPSGVVHRWVAHRTEGRPLPSAQTRIRRDMMAVRTGRVNCTMVVVLPVVALSNWEREEVAVKPLDRSDRE